ncbi:MAG: PorT family protein [Chlorobi bacterium]|nr:PorT family protein [Chlorobiota bacterium]
MKKTITFILLFASFYLQAQNIGIFAGGGLGNFRLSDDMSDGKNSDYIFTYYAGFNFENTIVERQLYFQLGLQAISQGSSGNSDSIYYFMNAVYIPLELKYKYFFSKRGEGYVFVSGGPFFSAFYKGTKTDIALEDAAAADTTGRITFDPDIKFGKLFTDDFSPFDYGIHTSLGYGYDHLQVTYNLSFGLADILTSEQQEFFGDESFIKTINHSLTIAYYFSNK